MMNPRIRRVPIQGGVPLTRLQKINCLCGNSFIIDLGARGQGNEIHCPRCGSLVGSKEKAVLTKWDVILKVGETTEAEE